MSQLQNFSMYLMQLTQRRQKAIYWQIFGLVYVVPVKRLYEKLAGSQRMGRKNGLLVSINPSSFSFSFFFWCCIPASFIHVSLEHEGKYIYFVTGASLPTTVPHRNNNACNISKYIFLAVFFRVLWVKYLKLSQDYLQKGSLTTMIVRI